MILFLPLLMAFTHFIVIIARCAIFFKELATKKPTHSGQLASSLFREKQLDQGQFVNEKNQLFLRITFCIKLF